MTVEIDPTPPIVSFFKLVPDCPDPQRADRAAGGTLPTRAFRYCDPITTAAAFGWYVFPPIGFTLVWDGTEVTWTFKGADGWYPLSNAQFPGFARHFDAVAPADLHGFSPPFLNVFLEPGIVQIWSGLIARTSPGWSLLVRPVPNFPRSQGYDLYEGIVETDSWFGPLFTNVRLTRTDGPIEFKAELPLFQVQPIHRSIYEERLLENFTVVQRMEDWTGTDWDGYRTTVVAPNVAESRQRGQHAVEVRRRRRRSVAQSSIKDKASRDHGRGSEDDAL